MVCLFNDDEVYRNDFITIDVHDGKKFNCYIRCNAYKYILDNLKKILLSSRYCKLNCDEKTFFIYLL